ncbi:hypothetical protein P692DRAFT_201673974, partial [Suillus brevipes Sb2]
KVVIMPHNLPIINYVIRVPGSVHDLNAFSKAHIACHPQTFLGGNEWIWADSAYGSHPWCVMPFKQPSAGGLTYDKKAFNYHLSKIRQTFLVRVRSEHGYGSLKGCFQSLYLDEANMWTQCCLILHNMIIEIK